MVADIAEILHGEVPDCSFIQLLDKKRFQCADKAICPPSLIRLAKSIDISHGSSEEQVQTLLSSLDFSDESFKAIEVATKLQSASLEWKEQKVGRIT